VDDTVNKGSIVSSGQNVCTTYYIGWYCNDSQRRLHNSFVADSVFLATRVLFFLLL
jgi:hypothetical protein